METKEKTYAQVAIRERISEKARSISLIKYIIVFGLLLFPMAAFAMAPSDADRCNATYTQSQIDSLVSVEVQRQVDTQLIGLKIDKAARGILEKYRKEQAQFQDRHDYFLGVLFTLLVAVVGIVIPLILNQDREKKIKRVERKLSEMMSSAQEGKFSIDLTRALANDDADIRIFALSQIIRTHKDKPYTSYAYNNRGCEYDDKGDYSKAIADYTKAIQLKPDYAEAYNNRGNSYSDIEEIDKAIEDYSKAIEVNPDYYVAYSNRAGIFIDKEMYKEALRDLRKAIKLNPYSDKAFGKIAQVRLRQGKYKDALKNVNAAIRLNGNDFQGYYLRSFILVNLKQYENALDDAKMSLRIAKRKVSEEAIIELEKYLEFVESLQNIDNGNESSDNTNTNEKGRNVDNKDGSLTVYDENAFNEEDLKRMLDLLKKYFKDSDRGVSKGNANKDYKPFDEDEKN